MKISDKKLQEKIKWTPHEKQAEVLRAFPSMREIVINAGRRGGKSALCAYIALKYLLMDDKKIWIVAPTYDLTQKVFFYLVRWFMIVAPSQAKTITKRPQPKIQTARRTILECKSADTPVSLLGEELDLLIIDEAARIDRKVWEQFLFPALASRQGKVIFISTPRGKNWFWEQNNKAKERGASFHFTSVENPHFPKEEWERAKEMLPAHIFKQEYMAEFLDDASAVFRNVKDIVNEGILSDAAKGRFYTMGVDLGKYHDYTVLTVIDKLTHNVVHIDRFKEIDWNLQTARIKVIAKRYNNARIVIDSTGLGDPITDNLRTQGLLVDDLKFSNKSKQQLIEKLMIWIEEKNFSIPPHAELLNELDSFGYRLSDSGTLTYSAPSGQNDDCVSSLALAIWQLQKHQKTLNVLHEEINKGRVKRRRTLI